jgi:AP endonuclease 2
LASSQSVISSASSFDTKVGDKRKRVSEDTPSKSPVRRTSLIKSKPRTGQASISNFFRGSNGDKKVSSSKSLKAKSKTLTAASQASDPPSSQPTEIISFLEEPDIEADFELARRLAEEDAEENSPSTKPEHRKSWSKFFVRCEPPKCIVHGEPCKELVTTKPGPNKGKHFWICSRFVLFSVICNNELT